MSDVTIALEIADGSIYRATGWIDIQSWQNQDNKLTLSMHPRSNNWALFSGAGDSSGSIRKVAIAGVTYSVAADCDVTFQPSEYKNDVVPTSGNNLRKMVRQSRDITGLVITANSQEVDALRQIAEG